mgnify:CR=1 FL=1
MQKQIKAWIYCRVREGGSRILLDYQAAALEDYALMNITDGQAHPIR